MYVDPKAFYQQILISKQEDQLTKDALKMLSMIVQRYSYKFTYKNEMDREDCEAYAIMQILRNWRSYDPQKNANAFAYFTQAVKTGMYMGWNKLYAYKKEGIHFSMNDLNL